MRDQLLLYEELGQRTPPPPPYSLRKRDTTKMRLANEVSHPPAPPPPPPPYLTSTPKPDCTVPSIDELWRQAVASDDLYLRRNGNAILLPPVPPERAQVFSPQQDYLGHRKHNWCCPGVPAHPVEPKWAPVGVPAYPRRRLEKTAAPLPQYTLAGFDHTAHQTFVSSAGTGVRPDHEHLISQSPSTVTRSVSSCPAHCPNHTLATVALMDQKPLQTFRMQSSRHIASLANIIENDATGSIQPFDFFYPRSALPSQQTVETRDTLISAPRSQGQDTAEKVADVRNLLRANEDSSGNDGPSDGDGDSTPAGTVPKGQKCASPARSDYEPRPPKDCTMSQGPNRRHHYSQSRHRRPSASARFVPYERRQSQAAEKMGQRVGDAVVGGCAKSPEMQLYLKLDESGEGTERNQLR